MKQTLLLMKITLKSWNQPVLSNEGKVS